MPAHVSTTVVFTCPVGNPPRVELSAHLIEEGDCVEMEYPGLFDAEQSQKVLFVRLQSGKGQKIFLSHITFIRCGALSRSTRRHSSRKFSGR